MGKPQKVAKLLEKRLKIEKEIEKLQKSCNHSTKSIKQVRERVGSSNLVIRYVCNECLIVLGYPNQQDINNFFKE
tara:strand:- start:155 stop:379 length:225 start_codon:yes stop_codon:yes gene_type:complete